MSTAIPLIPDSAPFSAEQRAWLNGFFAGIFSRTSGGASPQVAALGPQPQRVLTPLTILFGSQTGTAEGLAKRAAKEAGKRGFAAAVLDMAQIDPVKLANEINLLVIVSTYGDGEPPDSAKPLHASLQVATLPAPLASLRYSVCALGDTNYTQFCKCGQDFDNYLERHGATRIVPRIDCDLDYEEKFTTWLNTALSHLGLQPIPTGPAEAPVATADPPAAYSKKNPFRAPLLASRPLNAPGSAKQVNHVEFDLSGSGLLYEAGDALAVIPHNCPSLVAEVLATLGCDGEEAVPAPDGSTVPFRRALTEFYDLGKPTADLLALCELAPPVTARSSTLEPTPTLPLHVIDALLQSKFEHSKPKVPAPAEIVGRLRKLQPRLYSISSSPRAHPGQVHLTVGVVRYENDGRPRKGVCSTFLAERAVPGSAQVGVFVHSNKAFRPPTDGDAAMIMVGPGTGIAPFRAFLHERKAVGAKGKNWLFFGDQRTATDFLYREELAALKQEGVLTRLDTAFSRDQAEKIYVQHRMLEHAAELYAWLEAGAHFYVCGDASRMAKDVDAALHTVIERAGGKTAAEATAYVLLLRTTKRYARDVY